MRRTPHRRAGKGRRCLELKMFAPDPLAWVDEMTDEEFGNMLGKSWRELTGRCADYLIPDHSTDEGVSHVA